MTSAPNSPAGPTEIPQHSLGPRRIDPGLPRRDVALSVALDHVRWIAAFAVFGNHLRSNYCLPYWQVDDPGFFTSLFYALTTLGAEAVLCFFVISGTLVGGITLERHREDTFRFATYGIDRLVRLWVVLIPCIVLTVGAGALLGWRLTGTPWFPPISQVLGNTFFLQDLLVAPLVHNPPLWSLANEFWYYLLFPLALSVRRFRRADAGRALLLAALVAALLLTDLPDRKHILGYFSLWLLGLAILVPGRRQRRRIPVVVPGALMLLLLAAMAARRVPGPEFVQHALIALVLVWLLRSAAGRPARHRFEEAFDRPGRVLAALSYSLYLSHWPILTALRPFLTGNERLDPRSWTAVGTLVIASLIALAGAWTVHVLFERRTDPARNTLRRWFGLESRTPSPRQT